MIYKWKNSSTNYSYWINYYIKNIKTRNSLFKILILEINDKEFLFSWSFKRA